MRFFGASFLRPALPKPDVRVPAHPALHEPVSLGYATVAAAVVHGVGIQHDPPAGAQRNFPAHGHVVTHEDRVGSVHHDLPQVSATKAFAQLDGHL